jgi:hypothetical protein
MKKIISIIPVILIVMSILLSCKKSDSPINYVSTIKDKTWWGTFSNAGENNQYYSVHFNADNSLLWSQLSGDYAGLWILDGNKLTMNFTTLAIKITAEISDDNTLLNITTNSPNKVYTGKLNNNTDNLLDNTVWKETNNSPSAVQLSFFSGLKVEAKIGPSTYATNAYIRSSSGFIRFTTTVNYKFFGVFISDIELRGSYNDSGHSWQIIKQ